MLRSFSVGMIGVSLLLFASISARGDGPPTDGSVVVAPSPSCTGAAYTVDMVTSSAIARHSILEEDKRPIPWGYPFSPILAKDGAGVVSAVWTPEARSPAQAQEGNAVVLRPWSGGKWGALEKISSGGDRPRILPAAAPGLGSDLYVAWIEGRSHEGLGLRDMVFGAGRLKGKWSEPVLMSDRRSAATMIDWRAPGLIVGDGGRLHVFWIDDRERKFVFEFMNFQQECKKVYHRMVGEGGSAAADRVIPDGRYNASDLVAAPDPRHTDEQIVFWESSGTSPKMDTSEGKGLFTVRYADGRWTSPARLYPPPGPSDVTEAIQSIEAVRTTSKNLIVMFRALPLTEESMDESKPGFFSELKVLRLDESGNVTVRSVAKGIGRTLLDRSYVHADVGPHDELAVAYEVETFKWNGKPLGWLPDSTRPIELMLLDSGGCRLALRTAAPSEDGLFDVAVDRSGDIHLVWVEDDGDEAVLRHALYRPRRDSTKPWGATRAPTRNKGIPL